MDNIAYGTKTIESVQNEILDFLYKHFFVTTKTYNLDHFDSNKDGKIDCIQILINYPIGIGIGDSNVDAVITNFLNYDNIYYSNSINAETPVNSFSMSSEFFLKGNPYNLYGRNAIYQLGKMMGLENYSDTVGNADGIYRTPMGYKDMMDGFQFLKISIRLDRTNTH